MINLFYGNESIMPGDPMKYSTLTNGRENLSDGHC